jgi:WD40 repeat protein
LPYKFILNECFIFSLAKIDRYTIVSGGYDFKIKIWDVTLGKCLKILFGHSSIVSSLLVLNNNTIVSGSWDNSIKVWDIESSCCINTFENNTRVLSLIKLD